MPTIYPSLAIGASRRLAMFRAEAQSPKWVRPMSWRDVRFATLRSESGLSAGFNDNERGRVPVWYTQSGAAFPERFADEVARFDHEGWFTDGDEASETARGIVARLPHGRFLAGYLMSMNGERVYFAELFDDESDAARMADKHARVIGEDESDHARRWREAQSVQDDADECVARIAKMRACHSDAIAAREALRRESAYMRGDRFSARAETLRRNVAATISQLRELRERLASEFADVL